MWKRKGRRKCNNRLLKLDLDRVPILCYVLTEAESTSCNQVFCKYRLRLIFDILLINISIIHVVCTLIRVNENSFLFFRFEYTFDTCFV